MYIFGECLIFGGHFVLVAVYQDFLKYIIISLKYRYHWQKR